jgi:hypothetical protein
MFITLNPVDVNDQELRKLKATNPNKERDTTKLKPKVKQALVRPATSMEALLPPMKNYLKH